MIWVDLYLLQLSFFYQVEGPATVGTFSSFKLHVQGINRFEQHTGKKGLNASLWYIIPNKISTNYGCIKSIWSKLMTKSRDRIILWHAENLKTAKSFSSFRPAGLCRLTWIDAVINASSPFFTNKRTICLHNCLAEAVWFSVKF